MSGHGHVIPGPAPARCGGPGLCQDCAAELARVKADPSLVMWPAVIRCHDRDLARSTQVIRDRPVVWEDRQGRPTCSYCGGVSPRWLFEHFAQAEPTPPPWAASVCGHPEHGTAEDFRVCERAQLDKWAAWRGIEPADPKYGWLHKVYLHLPGTNGVGQVKFYTIHLADLPDNQLALVADVLYAHTGWAFGRDDDGHLVVARPT